MQKKDLIGIRPYTPDDENFVYTTWLKALRFGNDWFERIPEDIYSDNYRKVINAILTRAEVKVAHLLEDPTLILGFSVVEPQLLHFVYVKPAWRRIRIAKDLIPKDIRTVTHMTNIGWALAPPSWLFNPFAISQ